MKFDFDAVHDDAVHVVGAQFVRRAPDVTPMTAPEAPAIGAARRGRLGTARRIT